MTASPSSPTVSPGTASPTTAKPTPYPTTATPTTPLTMSPGTLPWNERKVVYLIARYREDIQWLRPIWPDVWIMNKGVPLGIPNESLLPNVGREADSYLNFIIQHYPNDFPEVVVFSQGFINNHYRRRNPVYQVLVDQYLQALKYGSTPPNHVGTWFIAPDWNANFQGKGWFKPTTYPNNTMVKFSDWFQRNMGYPVPVPTKAYTWGQFAVRRERILRNPIEVYRKLKAEVEWHVDPIQGYFIERTWIWLFNDVNETWA